MTEGKVTVPEWLCLSRSRLLCFVLSINLQTMMLSVDRVMKSSMMAAECSVNVCRRFGIVSIRNRSAPASKASEKKTIARLRSVHIERLRHCNKCYSDGQ